MEYRRFAEHLVLRLDPGDEVCEKIMEVCRRERVSLASVSGIEAGDRAELGLYDVSAREFRGRIFSEPFEIVSLMGNVTEREGRTYLHLHAALADSRLCTWSGHLKSCRISATGEIVLHAVPGAVGRMYDERTGLNILRFSGQAAQ